MLAVACDTREVRCEVKCRGRDVGEVRGARGVEMYGKQSARCNGRSESLLFRTTQQLIADEGCHGGPDVFSVFGPG